MFHCSFTWSKVKCGDREDMGIDELPDPAENRSYRQRQPDLPSALDCPVRLLSTIRAVYTIVRCTRRAGQNLLHFLVGQRAIREEVGIDQRHVDVEQLAHFHHALPGGIDGAIHLVDTLILRRVSGGNQRIVMKSSSKPSVGI